MKELTSPYQVDFDEWRQLADNNPKAFEIKRRVLIDRYLDRLPVERRNRMEKLQWRIDMEIRRSPNDLSALIRIYDMMMTSVLRQKQALTALLEGKKFEKMSADADIIPLPGNTVDPA